MSLLFGKSDNHFFNSEFLNYSLNIDASRNKHEWMQIYPGNWNKVLKNLFSTRLITQSENIQQTEKNIIELNSRINFKFNIKKYLTFT
ncbi:MAG: hypothetical protein GY756_00620 [bacterium]|nr:hypothetical protein [bacterium]